MLRLGFIGGSIDSAIGYTHYIAARMDNKFSIDAACFSKNNDINLNTANLWSSDNPIRIYNNYLDLLNAEHNRLDAICILTPTTLHKQIVIDSLNLNYPVICEKTLCVNLDEAKDISIALNSNNERKFLSVIYNYTGYPILRELKAMIANNEFGKIFQINVEMPQESFISTTNEGMPKVPQSWRLSDGLIPTISLDLGIHCHNLIYFLVGKRALCVYGDHSNYGHFDNIVDNVNVIAKYEDDITVNMWFSKCALGYRNGLKIKVFGEKLSATWIQTNPEEIYINTQYGDRIIKDRASPGITIASHKRYNRFKAGHPQGFVEAFANYYYDVYFCLQDFISLRNSKYTLSGKESLNKDYVSDFDYIFGLQESLEGLLFFESIVRSVNEKRQIIVDYDKI